MATDTQIIDLERRVAALDAALAEVRHDLQAVRGKQAGPPRPGPAAPLAPQAAPSTPPPAAPAAPPAPPAFLAARPAIAWEDLLAGRVMAWVGGSAVIVGLVFFLALAVSRGWIGEEARTVLAGLASLALIAGGALAYERRGRTEAALAATAAGIAGVFATLAVATEVYALVPAAVGLTAGLAVGAAAAALALRWRSRTIAVLGIAGALLSPVLVGADLGAAVTIGLLAAAYAGAVMVCVALGWAWLGLLAFALVTPQWMFHVADGEPGAGALCVVIAFALLGALAATGFAIRVRAPGLRITSHLLLGLNALVAAPAGVVALQGWSSSHDSPAGELWLVGLAAAHLLAGFAGARSDRVSRSLAMAALGIGVVLADIAFADLVDGLALPLAWAAGAAGFALLLRAGRTHELDRSVAALGLGGHLALAIGHVLTQDAPFGALGGNGSAAGLAAAASIAACCTVSARLVEDGRAALARMLDLAGLVALAYLTALAFGGAGLAAAWAGEAVALAAVARHGERAALPAAAAFLMGALAAALATAEPAHALWLGVEDLGSAVLALLAVASAALMISRVPMPSQHALVLRVTAATALLYLASAVVVTLIDGQPGQLGLSALWGAAGMAALLWGVARDHAPTRACALALLAASAGKVFVVDLAALDSMARVGSFLVLGTLLLAGAFAWQRARPDGGTGIESQV